MSDKNLPLKVSAIASSAVFNLAFGIAGLIVHLQNNMPDPLCGLSNYYLSLSKWLEGFGIANIIIFGGWVGCALLLDTKPTLFQVWGLIVGMFSFAWMIVGSVVLFRDDMICEDLANSLWQCSLACVISYYVAIVFNVVFSCFSRTRLQ